jgi:hypothetical protein
VDKPVDKRLISRIVYVEGNVDSYGIIQGYVLRQPAVVPAVYIIVHNFIKTKFQGTFIK